MKPRKSFKQFIAGSLLLTGAALLPSCTGEEVAAVPPPPPATAESRTPVVFQANSGPLTRTTNGGDEWLTNDRIGIFMLSEEIGSEGSVEENKRYKPKYTGPSSMLEPDVGQVIFYPGDGAMGEVPVGFIAYYPYQSSISAGVYQIDVANQSGTDPNDIDLLYAKVTGKNKSSGPILFTFAHQLCKLTVEVVFVNAAELVAEADNVSIGGLNTTADFVLDDGTLGNLNNIVTITPHKTGIGPTLLYEAILIPQTGTGTMVIGSATSTPPILELLPGKHYNYKYKYDGGVLTTL